MEFSAPNDEVSNGLLLTLHLRPLLLCYCGWTGKAVEVDKRIAGAGDRSIILQLSGLHIGDGNQKQGILRQECEGFTAYSNPPL